MFVRPVPLTRTPRVSVVVPCYNYGHYLPQLVPSLVDQPGVDVDVLIVDDASPDGSGDVAERIAEADSRVSVIRHAVNRGHIQTYNDGIAAVNGDYVVLLSADDLVPEGGLSRAVALMEAYPQVGFVYGFARSFSGRPPEVTSSVRNWSVWHGLDWLSVTARKGRCFISSPEVVMRRTALQDFDGYDPRLPHSADFDMWMRTAVNWDVGRVNGPVQALYRVHDANMHLTAYAGWATDLQERRTTFEILFEERAPDRPQVTALRSVAMRALAKESLRRALTAHRDGGDPGTVDEHLVFALETDPSVRASLLWAMCELGPMRGRSFPGVQPRRFGSRLRQHLEWRHERRYGT